MQRLEDIQIIGEIPMNHWERNATILWREREREGEIKKGYYMEKRKFSEV